VAILWQKVLNLMCMKASKRTVIGRGTLVNFSSFEEAIVGHFIKVFICSLSIPVLIKTRPLTG